MDPDEPKLLYSERKSFSNYLDFVIILSHFIQVLQFTRTQFLWLDFTKSLPFETKFSTMFIRYSRVVRITLPLKY